MALRTFHPCQFGFKSTNIRRVGNTIDGGTALSGVRSLGEIDGGGYLQADFTNGNALTRAQGNAWRAITDSDAGDVYDVLLCPEALFQPDDWRRPADHRHDYDDTIPSSGTDFVLAADVALRATSLTITAYDITQVEPGQLFSIQHLSWGWRAYRIRSRDGNTITFRTPLREAVTAGTALEFRTPRCQMVLLSTDGNPTEIGQYTSCSATFVEDMSIPQ